MRRAPLLAAACWFALGTILARSWHSTILLLLSTALFILLAACALRWTQRIAVLPVAALWIVTGTWCWQIRPVPLPQRGLLKYADGLSRNVRGRVVRIRSFAPPSSSSDQDHDPTSGTEQEGGTSTVLSVDVAVDAIEEVTPDIAYMIPASGGVRVTLLSQDGTPRTLHCGNEVEMPLRLKIPERYGDPGAWQYADYLLDQGISVHGSTRSSKLHLLSQGTTDLRCRIYAAQSWAANRMLRLIRSPENSLPAALRLTDEDAGMLNAMIFGDRTRLTHSLRLGFERTGSFHLFVVSGMHVALLAGIVFWAFQRLRLPRWAATFATLTIMTGYAFVTGFGAPVQRALFMTAVFLLARLLSRKGSVLNALGAAALAELVWSPSSLFTASFQMTFLAIVAIAGIAVPLGERTFMPWSRASKRLKELWLDPVLPPRLAQFRVMLRLWNETLEGVLGRWAWYLPVIAVRTSLFFIELALIGLVAEMIMALPMAIYFHRATVFALPANMLTVPVVGMLTTMAMLTFCGALIGAWAAFLPAAVTAILLHGVVWSINHVSHVQAADLRIPAPMWWVTIVAIAAWAFCCWAVRRSAAWAWCAAATLLLVLALVLWPASPIVSKGTLEVTALDVGQGDSLLIINPQGSTMLVDAGGPVGGLNEATATTSSFDVGEEIVSSYLWSRRIRKLDIVVLSHAHSDHMGGMPAVLRNFRPRELWIAVDPDSEAYRALQHQAAELGVQVRHLRAGDKVNWGEAQVDVLSPQPAYKNAGEPTNDDSLVLRMQYGKASALLEGDAEASSEQAMLLHHPAPVTLLKIGHHGSRTSTTPEFLASLAPRDAIVSVGKGNTFGHPRPEVVARIAASGARLYRTDEFGLVTFLMDRNGKIRELPWMGAEEDQSLQQPQLFPVP